MPSIRSTIARGTTLLTIGSALSRLVSLLTVIIITRVLSLYDYGIVALALAAAGPVFSITSLGMDELLVSDVARELGEGRTRRARAILRSFVRLRFILLAALLICGWFLRGALVLRYGPAFTTYFWILAAYVAIQGVRSVLQIIFQITKRFGVVAAANTGELAAKLAVVLFFTYSGGLDVKTVLAAYAIAAGVVTAACIPVTVRALAPFRNIPTEPGIILLPILFRHGKWQALQSVASDLISSIRYFLIHSILSTEAVAIFSVAQSMYSTAASVFPFKFVLFPILAGVARQEERARRLITRATKYSLLAYVVLMVGVWILARPVIGILFPKYLVGVPILMLMALRLPLNAFSIAQAPLFTILRDQRVLCILAAISGFSMLILMPPLMWRFSLVGAVVEGLITVSLVIVLREIHLRRRHHLKSVTLRTLFRIDALDRELISQFRSAIVRRFVRQTPREPLP